MIPNLPDDESMSRIRNDRREMLGIIYENSPFTILLLLYEIPYYGLMRVFVWSLLLQNLIRTYPWYAIFYAVK